MRLVSEDAVDLPLTNATPEEVAGFNRGDALFDLPFRMTDGLGPLYIRTACSACHAEAGRGPGLVEKMSSVDPATAATTLPYGATVRPFVTAGASTPIGPAVDGAAATVTRSVRVGPALWGRGYLEAIADQEIERVEREQSLRPDAIRGRINRVVYHSMGTTDPRFSAHERGEGGLIGRFGLKARVATVDDFSADALQGDMGITSPLRPSELLNPDGLTDDARPGVDAEMETVAALADYVRLIEIPRRDPAVATAEARALFDQVSCGACHVPALRTRADYPIPLLADIDAPIFSDLLLHDLGDGLADGVADESASGREWRTAPLIGIRFFRSYLHDGRAHSLDDAIKQHASPGSQANEAVERYQALSEDQRQVLLRYVGSL